MISRILDLIAEIPDKQSKLDLANIARRELENEIKRLGAIDLKVSQEEIHFCYQNKRLEAIKTYRNRTGCTLKEAKQIVEAEMGKLGIKQRY